MSGMVGPELARHGLVHALFRFFLPPEAEPRWFHVLAIVGSCGLMFAGFFGALFDFLMGKFVLGVVSLVVFAAGYGWGLAIRRSFRPADTSL